MGHFGHVKSEYRALVDRLDAGTAPLPEPASAEAWQGWKEILEILFTPEEAALAAQLPVLPATTERIAKRTGIAVAELRRRLDAMADKGVVLDLVSKRTGETKWVLAPPVVGFFEFSMMRAKDGIPKKRLAEAIQAYTHGDDQFVRAVFENATVLGRALAHETALDGAPEVLDWERATRVVSNATAIAVSLCYCRHKAQHLGTACDAPVEVCLSLNGGADFVIRHAFGRGVSRDEALRILHDCRDRGLVQIADNVRDQPSYLCNCCGCCCGQLQGINEWGLRSVNPSGFVAESDAAKCVGCTRCARACPITAVSVESRRSAEPGKKNELQSRVDADRCIGCGVCVDACGKDAMHLRRREPAPIVPVNVVDKAVRIALERGKLADLIFDEGENGGFRMLNQLVAALTRLPLAQRTLASEQVKSRFVRAVLKAVPPPV